MGAALARRIHSNELSDTLRVLPILRQRRSFQEVGADVRKDDSTRKFEKLIALNRLHLTHREYAGVLGELLACRVFRGEARTFLS